MSVAHRMDFEAALQAAASGATLIKIAAVVGLTTHQLMGFCRANPAFSQALKEAREAGFINRAEALPEIITNGMALGTFQDSKHLRVFVDSEKWLLSKLHAPVFGDKQTITHEYVDINQALQDARRRTLDVTPKPQAIENCGNPFADD